VLQAEASDIKLAFHSSTITMMHGPINIRFAFRNNYKRRLAGKCNRVIKGKEIYAYFGKQK